VVLVHPEIPPNTGNIIRLCANTGCQLHLIEPLGFELSDKHLRRAGLDYHEYANVRTHHSWNDFLQQTQQNTQPNRLFAFSTKGSHFYHQTQFQPNDYFVFGSETAGLPKPIRDTFESEQLLRLPMLPDQRSLNLSNSVAITVFEAWRQYHFLGSI
jgi:tRNA (cytidine/uridine-2'-O-)-methyltransferase